LKAVKPATCFKWNRCF